MPVSEVLVFVVSTGLVDLLPGITDNSGLCVHVKLITVAITVVMTRVVIDERFIASNLV